MSRERARRRAEREAAAAHARSVRERRRRRRARWQRTVGITAWRRRRQSRTTKADAVLVRHRRRQDGVLLSVLIAAHAVLWLAQPSWWWRASVLVLTVLCWPVLTVVAFDRRPTR